MGRGKTPTTADRKKTIKDVNDAPKDSVRVFGLESTKQHSRDDIKNAFHKIIRLIHPDKVPPDIKEDATDASKKLNEEKEKWDRYFDAREGAETPPGGNLPSGWLSAPVTTTTATESTTGPTSRPSPGGYEDHDPEMERRKREFDQKKADVFGRLGELTKQLHTIGLVSGRKKKETAWIMRESDILKSWVSV